MVSSLKKRLYFFVAGYFRFWARFVLERWQPRIVVVTGSNGKTTLLHLIESQLGEKAIYSHKANSAFGIPFHILGLSRDTLAKSEWIGLILRAPLQAFRKVPEQELYIVEADVDRPHEGKFLAELLRPEITLWVSSDSTHTMNFDQLVRDSKFKSVEDAIAYEYGWFVAHTQKLVLLNDMPRMTTQLKRTKAQHKSLSIEQLSSYKLVKNDTTYVTKKGNTYAIPAILPKISFIQVGLTHMLMKVLAEEFDAKFKNYHHPPGRSAVFPSSSGAILFDSSYNANLESVRAALDTFASYPGSKKWAVIGDMIELGDEEKKEHEQLAKMLASQKFERIILMGPRVKRYTKPRLRKLLDDKTTLVAFDEPKPVLDYLKQEMTGKEVVLFKGARWLEGVIKHLLKDPKDEAKLCRREAHYQQIREKWKVG